MTPAAKAACRRSFLRVQYCEELRFKKLPYPSRLTALLDLTRVRVEDQLLFILRLGFAEVKHGVQRAGLDVQGAGAEALAIEEDVLDEAEDGGLVGDGVVDEVGL